jgi:enoyl-CoA hydratase/carnithine racemase
MNDHATRTDHVRIAREGGVLVATLARADKKNALTGAMYEVLIEALRQADADPGVGAILITGERGVFTAGNDIGDFIAHAGAGSDMAAFRFVKAIASCETPLVAAVEGVAVGVGTTMLFHCDLVYAAPDATFRMPFVDLGLVPEAGSSLTVPQRFGLAKASQLLLLGEPFDAREAHRLGLVNDVVEASGLFAHAMDKARRLAAKPPQALARSRQLLRGDASAVLRRMDEEALAFREAMASPEARAAFMAFMNKSKS